MTDVPALIDVSLQPVPLSQALANATKAIEDHKPHMTILGLHRTQHNGEPTISKLRAEQTRFTNNLGALQPDVSRLLAKSKHIKGLTLAESLSHGANEPFLVYLLPNLTALTDVTVDIQFNADVLRLLLRHVPGLTKLQVEDVDIKYANYAQLTWGLQELAVKTDYLHMCELALLPQSRQRLLVKTSETAHLCVEPGHEVRTQRCCVCNDKPVEASAWTVQPRLLCVIPACCSSCACTACCNVYTGTLCVHACADVCELCCSASTKERLALLCVLPSLTTPSHTCAHARILGETTCMLTLLPKHHSYAASACSSMRRHAHAGMHNHARVLCYVALYVPMMHATLRACCVQGCKPAEIAMLRTCDYDGPIGLLIYNNDDHSPEEAQQALENLAIQLQGAPVPHNKVILTDWPSTALFSTATHNLQGYDIQVEDPSWEVLPHLAITQWSPLTTLILRDIVLRDEFVPILAMYCPCLKSAVFKDLSLREDQSHWQWESLGALMFRRVDMNREQLEKLPVPARDTYGVGIQTRETTDVILLITPHVTVASAEVGGWFGTCVWCPLGACMRKVMNLLACMHADTNHACMCVYAWHLALAYHAPCVLFVYSHASALTRVCVCVCRCQPSPYTYPSGYANTANTASPPSSALLPAPPSTLPNNQRPSATSYRGRRNTAAK